MYRTITKKMMSLSAALLYTPRHLGGLDVTEFSDAHGWPSGRGETEGQSRKFAFSSGKGIIINTVPEKDIGAWLAV